MAADSAPSSTIERSSITKSGRPFVHLHCHSHYSLLDGASPIGKLIDRVKSLGMDSVALTDHGNLHGALEFYQKAKSSNVNPIVGYEAYIAPKSRFERDASSMKEASYHLTLLAQNRTGFKNLVKLASAASLEGFYFKPRIDKELLQRYNEGIICLSGCLSSEFSRSGVCAEALGHRRRRRAGLVPRAVARPGGRSGGKQAARALTGWWPSIVGWAKSVGSCARTASWWQRC